VIVFTRQGNKTGVPFYQGLLAELEAEGEEAEGHWTDAFLSRIRGEISLKSDPANTTPAEQAFLAAIAVARLGLFASDNHSSRK
jgi:hypothetical protein